MIKDFPTLFKAPEFDQELINAIHSISPHLTLKCDENSRKLWQLDQNLSCWGEYLALKKHLDNADCVLELGPGMGRSMVFFSKMFEWKEYHAYEGNGILKKYDFNGCRSENSFCGNIKQLKRMLQHNCMSSYKIINANEVKLTKIDRTYDYIFSFYAVGYHWNIEHFWQDISRLLKPKGKAFFTVPSELNSFSYRYHEFLEWKYVNSPPSRILLINND